MSNTLSLTQDENELFHAVHQHILAQAKQGQRIETELELAERFGVTRYRIRKVLAVLSQMGVLDRRPKRGTQITQMAPQSLSTQIQVQMDIANFDIREFLEARQLIEVNILPLAIKRMTPALLGRLEAAITNIELHARHTEEADRWDREFHLLLLEACGNRVLQVFSGALITYFEKTVKNLPQNDPDFFKAIAQSERELLIAIKRADVDKAQALLKKQLTDQMDLMG